MEELAKLLRRKLNTALQFGKARRGEETAIGLSALLFSMAIKVEDFLKSRTGRLDPWHGTRVLKAVFVIGGTAALAYATYRIWRLVRIPKFDAPKERPSAIKGPNAFTPDDGPLFRRLGRESEIREILGYVLDDQVPMVVLMGASGAGKTSLLRAGLTDILKKKGIAYHYWEALPTNPGDRLLRVIQETWIDKADINSKYEERIVTSLEELVNPSSLLCPTNHVIVLDQFEQLSGRNTSRDPVFRILRRVAREAKPPNRITWIVSFRREFRADWSDFIIPEQKRGYYPPELSLKLFSPDQAADVIACLSKEAEISVEQSVVDNLVDAATVDGQVSPVDIGIGLLVLAELND